MNIEKETYTRRRNIETFEFMNFKNTFFSFFKRPNLQTSLFNRLLNHELNRWSNTAICLTYN